MCVKVSVTNYESDTVRRELFRENVFVSKSLIPRDEKLEYACTSV